MSKRAGFPLTGESRSYQNAAHLGRKEEIMETIAGRMGVVLPEQILFLVKAGVFLCASGVILYVALATRYPAVHDALHNFRHALAVVPCH
jgi:Probable cobalt transporter subunit (CbtB)